MLERIFFFFVQLADVAYMIADHLFCRQWNGPAFRDVEVRSIRGWIRPTRGYFPEMRLCGQTPRDSRIHKPFCALSCFSMSAVVYCLFYFCFNSYCKIHYSNVMILTCVFNFLVIVNVCLPWNWMMNSPNERTQYCVYKVDQYVAADQKVHYSYDASGYHFVIRVTFWQWIVWFW